MRLSDLPFNVSLLQANNEVVKFLKPISSMNIFDTSGINPHPNGLYSVEIFGRVGTKERDTTFSYIPLNTKIFHPEVFEVLRKLKGLYYDICSGAKTAVFDPVDKDFIASTSDQADSGIAYFMNNWENIVYKRTSSDLRDVRIQFIEKFKSQATMNNYLVMPAGLRDIEVDVESGQTKENDINGLYRKLLGAANVISNVSSHADISLYNVPRWTLQKVSIEIYLHIMNMLKGKSGFFQRKYGRRNTINGTRNVVTSLDPSVKYIDSPDAVEVTDTLMGFVQMLRGALPYTLNGLKNGILGETFDTDTGSVWLTDKKTLKKVLVELEPETFDRYATREGHEKIINRFFVKAARNKVISIDGYYLGLIYIDEKGYKLIKDIDELPDWADRKNVSPITLTDLLYTSVIHSAFKNKVGTMTRFPITGEGSIYATYFKVRTTTVKYKKCRYDDNWELDEDTLVYNFPDRSNTSVWQSSLVPHSTRMDGAGGDYDGDMFASPIGYSRDVYDEIQNHYDMKAAYVSTSNALRMSPGIVPVNLVVANMTGKTPRKRG